MTTHKTNKKKQTRMPLGIMHRYGVVHHSHTGKLIHRHHTSYPALFMIILAVAVLSFCTSQAVNAADTIDVTATVPAASVTTAASITSPTDGTNFDTTPITVSGSCQPQTYIIILKNGFESGTALCKPNWTYSLSIDLFTGANELVARIYNFTDMQGPDSSPVTVRYAAPVAQGTTGTDPGADTGPLTSTDTVSGSSDAAGTAVADPFIIKNDFVYRGFYSGKVAQWRVQIQGGKAPYVVDVNWGDTQTSKYGMNWSGPLDISHTYTSATEYKNTYDVKLVATDSIGKKTYMQFPAIINNPLKTTASIGFPISMSFDQAADYSWSAYIFLALVVMAFWILERHEHRIPEAKKKLTRKHVAHKPKHRHHHA